MVKKGKMDMEEKDVGKERLILTGVDEFVNHHKLFQQGKVEVLGAFVKEEVDAGRVKDTNVNYTKRLDSFLTREVK